MTEDPRVTLNTFSYAWSLLAHEKRHTDGRVWSVMLSTGQILRYSCN